MLSSAYTQGYSPMDGLRSPFLFYYIYLLFYYFTKKNRIYIKVYNREVDQPYIAPCYMETSENGI